MIVTFVTLHGFCNQNADLLGSLAGLSFPVVYVDVVECAPASPYTYSSSTHRFPDERTPTYRGYASFSDIYGAWFGLGSGFGIGFTLTLLLARALLLLAPLLSHHQGKTADIFIP